MSSMNAKFNRPALTEALDAWQTTARRARVADGAASGFLPKTSASNIRAPTPGGFRLGFQTRFTPPADDALEIAYDQFCETGRADGFLPAGSIAARFRLHFAVRPVV